MSALDQVARLSKIFCYVPELLFILNNLVFKKRENKEIDPWRDALKSLLEQKNLLAVLLLSV
jgi:hypothetical protein